MKQYKLEEVFRVARGIPENYISRAEVDDEFINVLSSNKHIIIYGSSKQGKTSLRKKCLLEADCIEFVCSNNWEIEHLYENILKRAGYEINDSVTKSLKTGSKVNVSYGVSKLVDIKVGAEQSKESAYQITSKQLEIDFSNVNDVIGALKEIDFKRIIVVEDFHYLPHKTQENFAVGLKAFHEMSEIQFIIVGVWLEENKLTDLNHDLIGRVHAINANFWSDSHIEQLFEKSENLLNINFNRSFKEDVKKMTNNNVFLVQEISKHACESENIFTTNTNSIRKIIGKGFDVEGWLRDYVKRHYASNYMRLVDSFQASDSEEDVMFKNILILLLEIEQKHYLHGLSLIAAHRYLDQNKGIVVDRKKLHSKLTKSVDKQSRCNIKPLIFEYDKTDRKLRIVDKSFFIWRNVQDIEELIY